MDFRSRLLRTLEAIQPVLEESAVLVVGPEVPNLLEPNAASTLVISQDVDIMVPLPSHDAVKSRLTRLRGLSPSPDEPSVWIPDAADRIEVNFIGMDSALQDPTEA